MHRCAHDDIAAATSLDLSAVCHNPKKISYFPNHWQATSSYRLHRPVTSLPGHFSFFCSFLFFLTRKAKWPHDFRVSFSIFNELVTLLFSLQQEPNQQIPLFFCRAAWRTTRLQPPFICFVLFSRGGSSTAGALRSTSTNNPRLSAHWPLTADPCNTAGSPCEWQRLLSQATGPRWLQSSGMEILSAQVCVHKGLLNEAGFTLHASSDPLQILRFFSAQVAQLGGSWSNPGEVFGHKQ